MRVSVVALAPWALVRVCCSVCKRVEWHNMAQDLRLFYKPVRGIIPFQWWGFSVIFHPARG